jgi:hypothetical protein
MAQMDADQTSIRERQFTKRFDQRLVRKSVKAPVVG